MKLMTKPTGGCFFVVGGSLAVVCGFLNFFALITPEETIHTFDVIMFFVLITVGFLGFRTIRSEADKSKRKNDEN